MAKMESVVAQTDVTRVTSEAGAEKYVRMLRDGTLSFADFFFVCELEGLVKVANAGGVASSPITFCSSAYDADAQDIGITVPDGTAIMVIRCEVMIDALTDDTDTEIIFKTSNTAITGTTGTAVTPVNKRNDKPTGSACTVYAAFDAAGGTDTDSGAKAYTFWHDRLESGAAPAAANNEETTHCMLSWVSPRDGLPAIVIDSGSVSGHVVGSTTGFITVEWVELESRYLK